MKGDQDWVQTPPQDFRSLCQRQSSFYLPTSVLNQDYQDFLQDLNTFPSEQNKLLSIDLQNISLYSIFNSEFYQSKYQLVYFWTELTGELGIVFNDFQDFSLRFRFSSRIYEIFSFALFRHDLLFSILISYSENHIRVFVDCVFSLT